MPAKKPRKTIGANPLDEVNDIQVPYSDSDSAKDKPPRKTRAPGAKLAQEASKQDPIEKVSHDEQAPAAQHEPCTADELFEAECKGGYAHKGRDLVPLFTANNRHEKAMHLVKKWSQWSIAAGIVPIPFVDNLAISGVQLKMVHDLCKHYGVKFEKEAVVAIMASLIGGALVTSVTGTITHVVLKSIPYAEQVLQPTLSFATTYSLGYVFVKHFENNGTLKNFRSKEMKGYFQDQLLRNKALFKKRKEQVAS
jgi:uncharacterized protein (DUF697 family)